MFTQKSISIAVFGCFAATVAWAEEPALDAISAPVVVTATRVEQNSFDLPVSIDAVAGEVMREGQLQANLSESAARVPGIVVNNRNNPAQDLAVQIRGFGARSAFGVRGVRLYADGIPMTMPDGQGQTGTFNLDTASRVEFLRGPFSALYGNSSGGVVQIFTRDGSDSPALDAGVVFGSYGTQRDNVTFGGNSGVLNYIVNASHYEADGYREHSDTKRDSLHAKVKLKLSNDAALTVVGTYLDQPDNNDPQGLTMLELKADRRKSSPNALVFNTRVSKKHEQVGATLDYQLTENDALRLMAYGGQRDNEQYLSTSVAAQTVSPGFARNGGGVSVIDRSFGGVDARWTHKGQLASSPFNITAGINYDVMYDDRTGFENFSGTTLGVKGKLRRDESNDATSFDQFLQATWDFHPRWSVSGGVRHSRVTFETKDSYITAANKDDSGSVDFSETTPVIGAIFKLTDTINLFANAGESFETPTFVEMGYNPDFNKSGLNLDLNPAKSRNYEIGAKAMIGGSTLVNLALFKIDTDDEIVVASAQGGRTTYRNVPTSERKGLELSFDSKLPHDVRLFLAYTLLDAKFSDSFSACKTPFPNGSSCRFGVAGDFETIASGSKIPGTYRYTLYGEASWKHAPSGFSTALEMRKNSSTNVSFNSDAGSAEGYTVFNWRGGFDQKAGGWKFGEFVRVENLFDQEYVGAVRVADGNGRFYEAAPTRNWLLGLNAGYQF